ncbi:MAG: radical SAM family heme chaperone HemW [Thiotrichales bacterium]
MNGLELPPLSLYVHVPWCVRKCPYCDFNSYTLRENAPPERLYVDALLWDLEDELPLVQGRQLLSIFIGGGTPSLFSADAIKRLLEGIRARVAWRDDIEITLEANPGTVEHDRFSAYRAAGVNRLSLGIQSFADAQLRALGRIHSGSEALEAVTTARQAGFENLNLDLMFNLPGQDLAASQADLAQAIALEPTHLSFYQLTLEPNTEFAAHPPALPDDDTAWAMQEAGIERLARHGYRQYEVSAYARTGSMSRHNRNYWEFGDYLAIGAGAHGKYTRPDRGEVWRRTRVRQPRQYLADTDRRIGEDAPIAHDALAFEFFLNALRLTEGFPRVLFPQRTGLAWTTLATQLAEATADGLLEPDPTDRWVRPSAAGQRFLNNLIERFLPDATPTPER